MFTLVLLAVSAVPVFAESTPGAAEEAPVAISPPEPAPVELPDAEDVREGIEAAEAEAVERERWLASSEAIRQREESRHAFVGLSAAESEQLFLDVFAEQLRRLNADPARWLSDATIVESLDESAATVRKEGDTSLLDATMPLRVEDEDGELRKVDLTLEATAGGLEPVNPLVELDLPDEAHEPLTVGEGGQSLAVTPLGMEAGHGVQLLGDKSAFYPDALGAAADTDQILAPTSTGVEIFELLRSADSPEVFRFELDLPEGAELLPDETGGARIVRDGEQLASIPFPYAIDAQGTPHEVDLEIEGDTVALHIPHRKAAVAYPLLLDPAIVNDYYNYNWFNGHNLNFLTNGTWTYEENHSWVQGFTSCQYSCFGPSGRALYISMMPGPHNPNEYGQWVFRARNSTTYLAGAWANPFVRDDHGCGNYSQPHDYVGMWHNNAWNGGARLNQAKIYGYHDLNTWGSAMIVGLGTGSGNTAPCRRDLALGGAAIWEDDWQFPYVNSVTSVPTGWIKKDSASRTINVAASDEGLGVQTVRMFGVGSNEWFWNHPSCAGTAGSRCPTYREGQLTFKTESFPYEGEVKFSVQAIDPTDKRWTLERTLKVDGTSPTIAVSGQLAKATKELEGDKQDPTAWDELSLPTYNLEIKAKDGSPTELRSGVKEITIYLDSKATPEATKLQLQQPCDSCPLTMDYKLKLPGLSEGKHWLKVVAVDFAGNVVNPERKIEFEYIPATGMKEEYVLQHFRLPDGQDHSEETEYHGPEIAVNVMNGNVVYHERDFDINTDRASLELERFYNSQLPIEKDTQWGHGWTLAQTPELKPEQSELPPQKGTLMRTSAITGSVNIPNSPGQPTFSSRLHATIDKTTGGGYEVAYESGAEVSVFSASGRIEETRFGDNSLAELGESGSPATKPTYQSALGTSGTGNGQLNKPADAAVDAAGNVWVADRQNHRIQKFSPNGEYLSQFGSFGSTDGQLVTPTALAIDSQGNIWVADGGNRRVQKFNPKGEFLLKFGSQGSGNGQFSSYGPRGIAIDDQGSIWVSDYSSRIQKFNSAGGFIKVVGSGIFGESAGLDAGGGKVWVGDWSKNRLSVFSEAGDHLFNAGASGTGPGQFSHPDAVELDVHGNVWVGDEGNARVQLLDQQGKYVNQFGAAGSGAGQFKLAWPYGLTSDEAGRIWVADSNNHRVHYWQIPVWMPSGGPPYNPAPVVDYDYSGSDLTAMTLEDPAAEDEPSLDVNLSSGLVSSVEEEETGTALYSYESGRLTAKADEEGLVKFANDPSGRLKRVELPNGTWAEISYDSTSRATKVTVDPAGAEGAKTTNFWYGEEPRETIVWGGGNPEMVYSIGEDGSVFKWSYADVSPAIDSISGSLWGKRNETQAIENKDHTLFVTGSSPHQIASIKVIANGNSVVEEKTCEDPSEPPSHVCEKPEPLEWITHASEHAAGRLDLEVLVTDFFGRSTAERFFVTIPQQPPPDPEAPERPTFDSIKLFREENGLDRNNPLTEQQMNRLILELLYEWERRDPIPMAAVEGWGVPMRAPELTEMEYRRQYLAQAAHEIPDWADKHAPATYGGYFVNNREGGKIYVGFTQNQASLVNDLKQNGGLMEPGQVEEMATPPATAIIDVEATEESVAAFIAAAPSLSGAVKAISLIPETGLIEVIAADEPLVEAAIKSQFGANAPIVINPELNPIELTYGRFKVKGPVVAGDAIQSTSYCKASICGWVDECTAAFSGFAQADVIRGQPVFDWFKLTAGHCFDLGDSVRRRANRAGGEVKSVGRVTRSGWQNPNGEGMYTDAATIDVNFEIAGHGIFYGNPEHLMPVYSPDRARLRKEYCWSGRNGGRNCGIAFRRVRYQLGGKWVVQLYAAGPSMEGDSGAPVWDPVSRRPIGIVSAHAPSSKKKCIQTDDKPKWCPLTLITPLEPFAGKNYPDGAMRALGIESVLSGN